MRPQASQLPRSAPGDPAAERSKLPVRAAARPAARRIGEDRNPRRRPGPIDHGIIDPVMNSIARQMLVAALLLAAVIVLFVAAESGQRRLEEAGRRVQEGAQRAGALADVWQLLRQAESSQRGYILLDDPEYLVPYQEASGNFAQAQRRLDLAFANAPAPVRADIEEVERLSGEKFTEMRAALEAYRTGGRSAAIELVRQRASARTMEKIDDRVRDIRTRGTQLLLDASRSWQTSRFVNLTITSTALITSVALGLLLIRLALRHMRSKELEAAELAQRRAELETLVERRTEELSELSTHLQSVAEQEKAALSRELHDELGGLLVAARMDVSWLEDQMANNDPQVRSHFKRVHEALQTGVEVKRRVVENLRPSLLDNLGLFPALRWQVADSCGRAGLKYTERYPAEEVTLTPEASIAVFRIVQEGLTNVLKHARAQSVDICLETRPPWLIVRIRDDGVGLPGELQQAPRSHGLAAMRHRAAGLGGHWQARRALGGGTEIEVRLPLERVLLPSAPSARMA
jgi:signal transduction histidine kinase